MSRSDDAVALAVERGIASSGDNVSVIAVLLRANHLFKAGEGQGTEERKVEEVEVEDVLSDVDFT